MGEAVQKAPDLRAFTVKGFAEMQGFSVRHAYKMIERGEIAAFPIGRRGLRIRAAEVERWQKESESKRTETETADSAGGEPPPLQTSELKGLIGSA